MHCDFQLAFQLSQSKRKELYTNKSQCFDMEAILKPQHNDLMRKSCNKITSYLLVTAYYLLENAIRNWKFFFFFWLQKILAIDVDSKSVTNLTKGKLFVLKIAVYGMIWKGTLLWYHNMRNSYHNHYYSYHHNHNLFHNNYCCHHHTTITTPTTTTINNNSNNKTLTTATPACHYIHESIQLKIEIVIKA